MTPICINYKANLLFDLQDKVLKDAEECEDIPSTCFGGREEV